MNNNWRDFDKENLFVLQQIVPNISGCQQMMPISGGQDMLSILGCQYMLPIPGGLEVSSFRCQLGFIRCCRAGWHSGGWQSRFCGLRASSRIGCIDRNRGMRSKGACGAG